MLMGDNPVIQPTVSVSPPYAMALRRWLEVHPSWSEEKAIDVAVSLFLIMHGQGNIQNLEGK